MYTDNKCTCVECGGIDPVPSDVVSHKKTPWAVICKIHGQVYLTSHAYQCNKNGWHTCPYNPEHEAEWDQENYDQYVNLPAFIIEIFYLNEWVAADRLNDGKKMATMEECIQKLRLCNFKVLCESVSEDDRQSVRVRNIFTNEVLPLELLLQRS